MKRRLRLPSQLGRIPALTVLCALLGLGCPGRPQSIAAVPGGEASAQLSARGPLTAASLSADVDWLCHPERRGRGSFQEGGEMAADYLAKEFTGLGFEVIRQSVLGKAETVIGIKRGGEQAVIVSAHADHLGVDEQGRLFPGADDNASGVAVMLAMARAAAAVNTRHTVLFVSFGAEEAGLIGSGVYIRDPVWPLAQTRAMINFDMVGRRFHEGGVDRAAAVGVVGLDEDEGARDAAETAARSVGLSLVAAPARLLELFSMHDRTDDWWFRRQGIVAVHFSTGLHDDYHRVTDTPDKLDIRQMQRVAHTALGLLWYFAEAEQESGAAATIRTGRYDSE